MSFFSLNILILLLHIIEYDKVTREDEICGGESFQNIFVQFWSFY